MSAKAGRLPLVPIQEQSFPRCGAKCKRTGFPCKGSAMKNGRCRIHGGKSTGARTLEGRKRSQRANWIHGHYSAEAKAARREERAQLKELKTSLGNLF